MHIQTRFPIFHNFLRRSSAIGVCLFVLSATLLLSQADDKKVTKSKRVDFTSEIQPIFKSRCLECHGATKQRGGFRLDSLTAIAKGGESGPVIVSGHADDSSLVKHITSAKESERMPPKGDPLTAEQIAKIRGWINAGSVFPTAGDQAKLAKVSNWSFQPIIKPNVPNVGKTSTQNPIDTFIIEKLNKAGLHPSPSADKRILARRVYLDLTGFPPTPEELKAFLDDRSGTAYESLVDRLLASPRYGEHWARHWLDIAHYADSHGQDQDRFRPNAWPYRDYLIRSFNDDIPYSQFVREQIAGDVLFPDQPQAIVATGFLAAGPWDESGLRDINENSIDRQIARYLDRDDIVTSTMTTFAGLTVHCARCHDHKFDPISQEDYYSLQAVFAGIDKAERAYDVDPIVAKKRAKLLTEKTLVQSLKGKTDPRLLTRERLADVAAFTKRETEFAKAWTILEPETWKSRDGSSLKALLDRSILSVGLNPERDRYTVTATIPQTGLTALRLELLTDDTLPFNGPGRAENGNLHLSEIRVSIYPQGKPEKAVVVKLKSAASDFDQTDWGINRAIDGDPASAWGIHPQEGKPHQAVFQFERPVGFDAGSTIQVELDQVHGRSHLIGRFRLAVSSSKDAFALHAPLPSTIADTLTLAETKRTDAQRAELSRWLWERSIDRDLAALPSQSHVYCGTSRYAPDGSFKPAKTPRVVNVLKRGEISKPGNQALPGAVEAISSLKGRFALKEANDEGQRRAALADWLINPQNPLTWRVIVNRVWHYHFGKGIVDTPNDFGKMGGTPSHPELLDWLAADFRDNGGSLKKLHRLIVTSQIYCQSTAFDVKANALDADNRLLWRMNRGKLTAEAVRDSVLQMSGLLDETMYGPPVKQFLTKPGIHVTPEANYERFDVDSAEARRKSIYRFIFRTKPDPMLEALDCPDASQSSPVRTSSISAQQALVLWNDAFMVRYADHLAKRAQTTAKEKREQLRDVCQRVLCRTPTKDEELDWLKYIDQHGLSNFCRVLLNSSEFLFID